MGAVGGLNTFPPDLSPLARANSLVENLVARSLLSEAQVERGQRAAELSGERIDVVLNKLGLVQDHVLVEAYAREIGISLCTTDLSDLDPYIPDEINPAFFRTRQLLLLRKPQDQLSVVVADPLDLRPVDALRVKLGQSLPITVAPRRIIEAALLRLYGRREDEQENTEASEHFAFDDIERLKDIASEAPVIRLTAEIIEEAVSLGASDIHITRSAEEGRVRLRIDGVLSDYRRLEPRAHQAVISRLKIMSGLDIGERRLPQDGRLQLPVKGREIDLRLSTMPHAHGEGSFLRILDRRQLIFDFHTLGFDVTQREKIRSILNHAFGLFLITGPTGSGKTTTLYGALAALNDPAKHIVTVEDPVEYTLPGINQIQVNRLAGLDFARTLRSVLRQDPDIIMIGEIRDSETAAIAVQAALTGHFVLATLHTNDALSAVDRLIDMGVEPFLLASVLRGLMAQRLVRRCCNCSTIETDEISGRANCLHCHGSGYSGRLPLAQVVPIGREMRDAIMGKASLSALEHIAARECHRNMQEEGQVLVERGLTSQSEVIRALGATE